MLKNFGDEFDRHVDFVQFLNDIFYSGLNNDLIDLLGEFMKICNCKYKSVTQIKLLNTVSIILT